VESMEMALRETRSEIAEVEASLRTIRQQREQYIREENSHAVRLAEVQTRIADLVQNIEDDYQFSLHEQRVPLSDDLDEMSARQEVQELREKIRSLGGVNELALENYEEEKERLDFLVSQRNDLERAESTLLQTIKEINETAAARFLETYDLIQSNFVRIFTELFGEGATAGLEMNDPGDPLESAIEIMAKPRGKRPTTITQLSGGEKTLTAIALLFAIYLVKPSPFCILDEVDAPLDDANVERFMRLIRDFSSRTQFILVTHNKRTMEAADRMYGVTMQEQGVSSLVGVRFDEALAAVNE
jgi:chromosome segregation protein